MYPYLGDFEAGKTIILPFHTFNAAGASCTISAFTTANIKVYKGVSMGQRASTAGFTLLDTDGIDLDGITGYHGFSIDTADNTDAGFYTTATDYTVVVDGITVDSQTVRFIAGRFSLENRNLMVDVWKWKGVTVVTDTVGYPKVTVKNGTGTGEILSTSGTVSLNMAQTLPGSPTADTVGDALKQATYEEAPKKNLALSDIPFYLVSSTDHITPVTGATVTVQISKNGGAFAAAGGTVTEIGSGAYGFDATQADMNTDVLVIKFTASGADPALLAISTVD